MWSGAMESFQRSGIVFLNRSRFKSRGRSQRARNPNNSIMSVLHNKMTKSRASEWRKEYIYRSCVLKRFCVSTDIENKIVLEPAKPHSTSAGADDSRLVLLLVSSLAAILF